MSKKNIPYKEGRQIREIYLKEVDTKGRGNGDIWLNMEQISKVYLGSCVQLYSLAETSQLLSSPPLLGSYTMALLVKSDKIDGISL